YVTRGEHLPWLVGIEQRPVSAVLADDLVWLHAVPQRQPAALAGDFRQDRWGPTADARRSLGARVRADPGLDMRLPVQRVGAGGMVDRGACVPRAAGRISEEQRAERPGLRPVLAANQPFEDQHVLVLVIEDDAFERPVHGVVGAIERRRMAFRA